MSQNKPADYQLLAEFYDHVTIYREREDIGFYLEIAQQCKGKVLELGCGTGRILLLVARAGMQIAGIDRSDKMLFICREKLSREPENINSSVKLFNADMRSFELQQKFDLVIIPFRAFQHLLMVEDQISCLKCVHKHLNEGGKLVLDLFNPSLERLVDDKYLGEVDEEPEFIMPDGRKVVRRNKYLGRDLENQILSIQFIFYIAHPDGGKERFTENAQMRYLFRFEAEHLLERCGFKVNAVYGDLNRTPFGSLANQELIFMAEKALS
jgi:SAM-dependent methyltransferase